MSGPVNVLAVLADYSAQHGDPEDFEQARAAVAELIEALSNLCSGLPYQHADLVAVLGASNAHEVWRLRADLARFRGEA